MTAPSSSAQPLLDAVKEKYGFVPNVIQEMSTSPATLDVYLRGMDAIEGSTLTDQERQVVILAISKFNGCDYCQGAHAGIAKAVGVEEGTICSILKGYELEDDRHRALTLATVLTLNKKGWLEEGDLKTLSAVGLEREQVYEIIALIGLKTITNYINHIAHTQLDEEFK